MFFGIGAFQRLGNDFAAVFAVGIPKCRQLFRIMLPADDGADDFHPGHAGNIADNVVQLDIHQVQRFLHMMNMAHPVGKKIVPMTV